MTSDSHPSRRIAIVTVSLNDCDRLYYTYRCLKRQDSSLFTWYVIDGLSNDSTRCMVENFEGLHCRFISEKDNGIYDAMNKGARLASEQFIMFLNAGDYLAKDYILPDILDRVANCSSDIYIFASIRLSAARTWPRYAPVKHLSTIVFGMPSSHQSFVYNSKFMKENPFVDCFKITADYAHLAKCYIDSSRITIFQFPLAVFVQDGLTYTRKGQALARPELYKIRTSILGLLPVYAFSLEIFDRLKMLVFRIYCFLRDIRCDPHH